MTSTCLFYNQYVIYSFCSRKPQDIKYSLITILQQKTPVCSTLRNLDIVTYVMRETDGMNIEQFSMYRYNGRQISRDNARSNYVLDQIDASIMMI